MSLLDWMIVVIPMMILIGVAFYSRRYTRDVVDYLAAGRIAWRRGALPGGTFWRSGIWPGPCP